MTKDLSIVLATYNRLDYLKRAIDSIISSSKSLDIEIIINDGNSNDGTIEFLKNLDGYDFIKPIFSKKLEGPTKAYNDCFKKAIGEFVVWFSDDMIVEGSSLTNMYNFMKKIKPNDTGAFLLNNNAVSKINGFYCPEVSCVRNDLLRRMNFWNTDYPYYGQESEFNARILRMGGKINICNNAKIHHLNINDELKEENVEKYKKNNGEFKFSFIYYYGYGRKSPYVYPTLGIEVGNDLQRNEIEDVIENINNIYNNIQLCIIENPLTIGLEKKFNNVIVGKHFFNWNLFDFTIIWNKKRVIVLNKGSKIDPVFNNFSNMLFKIQ